ncbi:hypothetical protein HID58_048334, partial [Brassica napus]
SRNFLVDFACLGASSSPDETDLNFEIIEVWRAQRCLRKEIVEEKTSIAFPEIVNNMLGRQVSLKISIYRELWHACAVPLVTVPCLLLLNQTSVKSDDTFVSSKQNSHFKKRSSGTSFDLSFSEDSLLVAAGRRESGDTVKPEVETTVKLRLRR